PTIYNRVTKELKQLPAPEEGPLTWYSCGPTVYDSAHLGHARTYVSLDVMRRLLTDYFGYSLVYAMGVTDIDDKIINRARQDAVNANFGALARRHEAAFFLDMAALGVRPPDVVVRVTEHLPEIVAYIERILQNGKAYVAADGVYFDVEAMGADYGRLGVSAMEDTLAPAAGVNDDPRSTKRSHKDFALWKLARAPAAAGEPSWPSPWGAGRPGWHIECSAMTHGLFGDRLTVHAGGEDLRFPHHTNEAAQCEAHSGCCEWVHHWVHTAGHVHIYGLKMSKSLKNFITVRQFFQSGDSYGGAAAEAADDYRIFCLMHKYSASVTYSDKCIENARAIRTKFKHFFATAAALTQPK
ncbi:unnamed protein product, partial [Phaeothamnion confervicola]